MYLKNVHVYKINIFKLNKKGKWEKEKYGKIKSMKTIRNQRESDTKLGTE